MRALPKKSPHQQSGIALLTTLLLLVLMSSLLIGFILLITNGTKLSGMNDDYSRAYYGAESGMEKMTADLGTLFDQTYAPSGPQVNALAVPGKEPVLSGITFTDLNPPNGCITPGYCISYPTDGNGNPQASNGTVKSGAYQGMVALAVPYTLVVDAKTQNGSDVKLQRVTQTVGIPMFQFGIFSNSDLSFYPGPNFSFGGRTHTNGDLYLAAGSNLTLQDHVTAHGDVLRKILANGFNASGGSYGGLVNIATGPGGPTAPTRSLAFSEGSITNMTVPLPGSRTANTSPSWPIPAYNGYLRAGTPVLNLGIVTVGGGTTQAVDIIRRPSSSGENPSLLNERYYSQASLRVLISDSPQDIMQLPCVDGTVQPLNLAHLATPVATWPLGTVYNDPKVTALYNQMNLHNLAGLSTLPLPMAASGALPGATQYVPGGYAGTATQGDGYWVPNTSNYAGVVAPTAIEPGYIKIEYQSQPYVDAPLCSWHDVTLEVLAFGYAGKNINPLSNLQPAAAVLGAFPNASQLTKAFGATADPLNPLTVGNKVPLIHNASLPGVGIPSAPNAPANTGQFSQVVTPAAMNIPQVPCPDPHPNAIIRLERIRDNPSFQGGTAFPGPNATLTASCGITLAGAQVVGAPSNPADYWPNTLFDTREGTLRDNAPSGTIAIRGVTYNYNQMVTLAGVMHYVEVDVNNLSKWFTNSFPNAVTSGPLTKDPQTAPNNFTVYISDRRGNYVGAPLPNVWPPLSPTLHETGEYGAFDNVNLTNPTTGCPNATLDVGEDLDNNVTLSTYGEDPGHAMGTVASGGYGPLLGAGAANPPFTTAASAGASWNGGPFVVNPTCAAPAASSNGIWPFTLVVNPNEARQNPAFFFRRAVKLVNGSVINLGNCPGSTVATPIPCGLTIATENPVYVMGDYDSDSAGNGFNIDPYVASSIIGDAVTMLSNNWNDYNSFFTPYGWAGSALPVNPGSRDAVTTWYRAAVVGGKGINFPQPSGTGNDFGTDGGVHNFLRYLENWGGQTLNYKGSLVSLAYSRQAVGTFKCCGTTYSPPVRAYAFDTNFLTPSLLPPRTPLFRDVNTTGFTQLLLPNQ